MKITVDLLLQMALLGLDSFVAGLVLGPLTRSWWTRSGLSGLFGLSDGAAALLGASLAHRTPGVPAAVLYVLVAAAVVMAGRSSRRWLLVVPVILSIDNLASGVPAGAAPALAVSSAAMALAGMAVSSAAVRAGLVLRRCFRGRRGAARSP